jgi:hypothetical protein
MVAWKQWWFAVPMVVVLAGGVSLMRVTMQEQMIKLVCNEGRRRNPTLKCDATSVIDEVRRHAPPPTTTCKSPCPTLRKSGAGHTSTWVAIVYDLTHGHL